MKRFLLTATFIVISAITLPAFATIHFTISNWTQEPLRITGTSVTGNFFADGIKNPSWNNAAWACADETVDAYTTEPRGWAGAFSIFSSTGSCFFKYQEIVVHAVEIQGASYYSSNLTLETDDSNLSCEIYKIDYNNFAISVRADEA